MSFTPYSGLGRNPNSNIQQGGSYRGLGRNPESNIKKAKPYRGLGRNPDSNIPVHEEPAGLDNKRDVDKMKLGRRIYEHVPPFSIHQHANVAEGGTRRKKNHAFELMHGDGGLQVWWGVLMVTVTRMALENEENFEGDRVHRLSQQYPVPNIEVHFVDNLDTNPRYPTQLDWWGNAFLYWEVSQTGEVLLVDVRGPTTPTLREIPSLNSDLERQGTGGEPEGSASGSGEISDCWGAYYVKLGSVPSDGPVVQEISSDVTWSVMIIDGTCVPVASGSGSSDSGASGGDSGSGPPDSGSSKDSCIVPVPWGSGFTALYCVESPDVLFFERMSVHLKEKQESFRIDQRFLDVSEPGSIQVYCMIGTKGACWGQVEDKDVVVNGKADQRVNLLLIGVRKGHAAPEVRFPQMTENQFNHNEERIQSFYPKGESL